MIIRDLFINMAIMVSLILLFNMLMHEKHLTPSKKHNLQYGFLSGLLGCLLMLFSVSITFEVILDFRCMPVILMAIYVSPLAAVEAALVIGIFRIAYFGLNQASIVAFAVILVVGIGCGLLVRTVSTIRSKWLISVVLTSLVTGTSIYYLTQDQVHSIPIVLSYLASLISVSALMYFFVEFIAAYNRKIERMKEEAEKDFLTGLKTPRQFDKSLNKHLDSVMTDQRSVALLYMDIDYFKMINDRHGHEGGDLVLQALGRILRKIARSQDVVSRKGGEEFTMLLVDCSLAQAAQVAERIRKAVEAYEFRLSDHQSVHVTVSIGVASIPETTSEDDKLLDQADAALYRAKQAGRNRVVIAG